MTSKLVGILNGRRLRWSPGDAHPHIEQEGDEEPSYLMGLPLTYSEAFEGIPPLKHSGQVGALATWGSTFVLLEDGTWSANNSCGTWSLSGS